MYLVGCHYSRDTYGVYEEIFLQRVRNELSQSLAMADRLLHFIIASTMLARWCGIRGRFVEMNHHSSGMRP